MKHVLIVEDDRWQAELLARQIENAGYSIELCGDGIAAFAAIDQRKPDVIILDMMLPGPNAMVFLHELRSHADLMTIPVIMCSTTPLDLQTLQPYGVTVTLDKATMHPDDVVVAVRKSVS